MPAIFGWLASSARQHPQAAQWTARDIIYITGTDTASATAVKCALNHLVLACYNMAIQSEPRQRRQLLRDETNAQLLVLLEPAPAMTGTRPAAVFTQSSTTRSCSSWLKCGRLTVVPTGTSPCVPWTICHSTNLFKCTRQALPLR